MALVASTGSKVYKRTPEQLAQMKRRAEFERSYSKDKAVFSNIDKTAELSEFSNGIANAIAMFKQSKRVAAL